MLKDHQRIATLEDRTYVEGVYSVVNPQLAQTRTNKPYLKCMIRDASGEISARADVGKPGTTLVTLDAAGEKLGPLVAEFATTLRPRRAAKTDVAPAAPQE